MFSFLVDNLVRKPDLTIGNNSFHKDNVVYYNFDFMLDFQSAISTCRLVGADLFKVTSRCSDENLDVNMWTGIEYINFDNYRGFSFYDNTEITYLNDSLLSFNPYV